MTTVRQNLSVLWNERVAGVRGRRRRYSELMFGGLPGRAVAGVLPRVLSVFCLVWALLLGLAVPYATHLIIQMISNR